MSTNTNPSTDTSLGAYFVHLFEVDTEQFQLRAQPPHFDRDSEYLNRPYELSDLMRQAA